MLRAALVGTGALLLLYGVLVGAVWGFQQHLVYQPGAAPLPPAAAILPGAREVVLETGDGIELGAWYLPAADPEAPAVLVANGNGGHRGLRAPLSEALAGHGLSVLLFDYRGYAGNAGSPDERGLALDVRAARRYLLEEGVRPDRLLYFGESLGAAVVTELAAEHPPAGLVLRSPFVDLASVGSVHYPFLPVRALLRDQYAVAEHVRRVHVPTVVVYGADDSIVPAGQSHAVAEAAPGLELLVEVPGADHNDRVLLDGEPVVDAVVELAEQVIMDR